MFEKYCCKMFDSRIGFFVILFEVVKIFFIYKIRFRIFNLEIKRFIFLLEVLERGIVSGKIGFIFDRVYMKSYLLEKVVEERMVVDVFFFKVILDEVVYYGLLNFIIFRV